MEKVKNKTPIIPKTPLELLLSVQTVVKNRSGAVLARQLILKSDHYDQALNTRLEFNIHGAPNFRMADMNIFGVAQPTVSGISAVLNLLESNKSSTRSTFWFSAREEPMIYINSLPFVLRESSNPLENLKTYHGISASRLEAMEARLKEDVLREVKKWNQLLLVHEELDDGSILPTWTAVDDIQTPREVFENFSLKGYNVKYIRLPISPEQAPEDHYLDEYVETIKNTSTLDALVFNCGMGVGRTTFAMTVAMIIRRAQEIHMENLIDRHPQMSNLKHLESQKEIIPNLKNETRTTLRLVYTLEQGLSSKVSRHSAIDWALARGSLIDDLRNAILGNYQCILQLLGVLADGLSTKKILDDIIDKCDIMTNLREVILMHRVKYYVSGSKSDISKALGCLERYFFLLTFCSYVNEQASLKYNVIFSSWLTGRIEIGRVLENMRKKGPMLYLFRPVEDLSALADGDDNILAGWGPASNHPLANELEKHVLKSRNGAVLVTHSILKIDQWFQSEERSAIEGACNFRCVPNPLWRVYGVAQPTLGGMKNVVASVQKDVPELTHLVWINLREEPLIYINGVPYVLRDQYLTLRNTKTFSGITPARLERIEERLKEDIQLEIKNYDNKIMLHAETEDGKIVPVWEDASSSSVNTFKEVAEIVQREIKDDANNEGDSKACKIIYHRVPITAETPPDLVDLDLLLGILTRLNLLNTSIVLNCQIGIGRSTTGTVIVCLILNWLNKTPTSLTESPKRVNYQAIHSLLRVIRNGLECKRIVDDVIDQSPSNVNLRGMIEQSRLSAETESDESTKKKYLKRGLLQLKRYFMLIVFQSYLDQNPPDISESLDTFTTWYHKHPEFQTIKEDMEEENILSLTPIDYLTPGDGVALSNEVLEVVNNRHGAVLAQGTIIKYDVFPGSQKLSLPEKIEGGPNYRRISLTKIRSSILSGTGCSPSRRNSSNEMSIGLMNSQFINSSESNACFLYGIAMPTRDAICRVLKKIGGDTQGTRNVLWTSLREEPVVYVNGKPYVLRLFPEPLKNLEATGIARERVELMETRMKLDIIAESQLFGGRVLLHEEMADGSGFSIVPLWETVKEEDVQTPLEIYQKIQSEGYHVDYLRIPITDEQAPIPDVFDQLVERLQGAKPGTDFIFNCQQGRGRTTTCMIIASLMQMIVGNPILTSDPGQFLEDDEMRNVDEEDVRVRYLKGEYKVILQLIAVLQYGKLSKRLTDKAIDSCEHLQNLRVAIFDFKLRIEASEIGTKKHDAMFEMGLSFADYLLQVWANDSRKGLGNNQGPEIGYQLFSNWLKDRREIMNIIKHQSLD